MRHASKNKYISVEAVMRAADKYTQKYGFKHRWYECDECGYYHIATVRHWGSKVLDLDVIKREAGD